MKGWNSSKHPILTANQMPAPIHWNPMNEDWKMRLTKSQIYNTSSGFDTQTLDAMKKLHDKILTFGGDEVCMTMFDDCLLYTSPSPRDAHESRMPSSA